MFLYMILLFLLSLPLFLVIHLNSSASHYMMKWEAVRLEDTKVQVAALHLQCVLHAQLKVTALLIKGMAVNKKRRSSCRG